MLNLLKESAMISEVLSQVCDGLLLTWSWASLSTQNHTLRGTTLDHFPPACSEAANRKSPGEIWDIEEFL